MSEQPDYRHTTLKAAPFRTKMQSAFARFGTKGEYVAAGHVLGGFGSGIPGQEPSFSDANDRYVADVDAWQRMARLPKDRAQCTAFRLCSQNRLGAYCVGGTVTGAGGGILGEVQEYLPLPRDIYAERARVPERYWAASVRLGDIGHVIGGIGANGYRKRDNLAYSREALEWSSRAPLPSSGDDALAARGQHAATEIDGHAYIFGGGLRGPWEPILAECGRYNPTMNIWARIADMPLPRREFSAFTLPEVDGNHGHALGGFVYDFSFTREHHRYTPAEAGGMWVVRAPLQVTDANVGWRNMAAFALRHHGYIAGGSARDIGFVRWCHRYDPVTNTWLVRSLMSGFERRDQAGVRI